MDIDIHLKMLSYNFGGTRFMVLQLECIYQFNLSKRFGVIFVILILNDKNVSNRFLNNV